MLSLASDLAAIVGDRFVLLRPSELLVYNSDGLPGYRRKPRLAVFPEFSAMEFASLRDRRVASDRRSPDRHKLGPLPVMATTRRIEPSLVWETAAIQSVLNEFKEIHADLARRFGVHILAGTIPVRDDEERLRNRAYFFTPEGTAGYQGKIVPTRWEREVWGVAGGDQIKTFETGYGPVGVAI